MTGGGEPLGPSGRQDPGWRPLLRYLPVLVWPDPRAWSWWLRRRGEPHIVILRATVTSMAGFYVVALAILVWLDLDAQRRSTPAAEGAWALALVVLCPAASVAGLWWSRRPMSCGGPEELKQAFSSRHLLPIAFISSGLLTAFVATFLLSRLWPYLIGMIFGLVGIALTAPTAGRMQRRAEELARAGCPGRLQDALF